MNKFSVREDIERSIKEMRIDRSELFEVSKFQWEEILSKVIERFVNKTHYTYRLHWAWLRLKNIQESIQFRNQDGYKYIPDLVGNEHVWFIVEDNEEKFWMYEGKPEAISIVIGDTFYFDEYYIVSKKFEWILCEDHHRIFHGAGEKIVNVINEFKINRPDLIYT